MPICTLLAPKGLTDAAKTELMKKMDAHIHEAYPIYGTYIFMREAERTDSMLDGELLLDNAGAPPRDGRICTLRCPPGATADAKKTMMASLSQDIAAWTPLHMMRSKSMSPWSHLVTGLTLPACQRRALTTPV